MAEPTSAELLLMWDRMRPRSLQRELGMSEVGGCQRRTGYILSGQEPDSSSSSIQAALGTAIHAAVADALRYLQAQGAIPPEDLIEHEVRFAGLLGHLDRYRSRDATVDDTKTNRDSMNIGWVKRRGPAQRELWQVHLYGAGLIRQGRPVLRVALNYIARDSGVEYRWEAPFDPSHVRDALDWLDFVRRTPVADLNREYAPDSQFCKSCKFRLSCWGEQDDGKDPRVVLFRENPDAVSWAARLEQARVDKSDAEQREAEAKGALEAIRPDDDTPIDVGLPDLLQWKTSTPWRLDGDQVKADYAAAGVEPPMKPGRRTELRFVAREQTDVVIPDVG